MFEKIKGIKIQSGIFENETILELFDGKFDGTNQTQNDRASLIFGRNGSGKSTIARGIQQLAIDGQEQDKLSFIDEHNDEITLGEMNKSSIFVFNEDYIEQKVKIAQDGLDTIVILGEQVDIDSQIDTLKESLSESQIEFQKYESELGEYKDDNNEKSPNYWKKKIASSLKGLGNWAERDREIKGNRAASPIHNDTFHKFVSLKPSLEKNDLEKEFQEKKERYFSLRDFAIPIKQNLEILDINFDRNAVADLLSKRIENPKLNPRDQHLLELLSDTMRGEPHLRQAKDFFSDEQNKICPFCTQPVSDSVKSELIDGITKLLSREVEEHQAALVKSKFCKLEKDLSNYKQLDSCLIRSYQDSLTTINSKLEAVNSVIDEKINNPYVVCKLPDIDISEDLAKLKSDTEKINQAIAAHNLEISDIENLKLSLLKMNNELAYYEIQSDYKKFQEKINEEKTCDENYRISKQLVKNYEKKISELENQKLNIDIAVDEINKSLNYIFFSKDRLSIQNQNGKYCLLSRGKSVVPSRISVGERNALALSYFFTEIIRQRSLLEAYNQEYFIVIDDPISSFDMENKVGITSYLKYCLSRFLKGDKHTRILLMTHDKQTMYDFDKFLQEIMASCKEEEGGQKSKYKKLELISGKLQEFRTKSHDYTELLEVVFEYAAGTGTPKSEGFVGNSMRKILEAYGSFNYKQEIAKLTTDPLIVNKIDEEYRAYFENLMYRLVLHGESHYEDPVKVLNVDFFDTISDEERKKTARDLLVLLYLLDDLHVLKHLAGIHNVKEQLEQWKLELEIV
ncbi:AAA family ATPase [Streptococcus suis]|uniref:AAA family ATPase n=1 Tax=Streptococcus suis TaxID=1307 RepID=A0A822VXA7_STRSU|nr:AAA family ATPase [Streptococcus suis]MBM0273749.1 AAA family ATPase [Streptococcus suis]MCK3848424.1 AAA family ATPase [Streptococcus suis]MCK3947787.1 AAA family ATPase [Streptococcus suis]MCK3963675.1 AAA family ATPase [Streptococcus suis]MCK3991383.1 AAA family ATPase [Streptococcus suis]